MESEVSCCLGRIPSERGIVNERRTATKMVSEVPRLSVRCAARPLDQLVEQVSRRAGLRPVGTWVSLRGKQCSVPRPLMKDTPQYRLGP